MALSAFLHYSFFFFLIGVDEWSFTILKALFEFSENARSSGISSSNFFLSDSLDSGKVFTNPHFIPYIDKKLSLLSHVTNCSTLSHFNSQHSKLHVWGQAILNDLNKHGCSDHNGLYLNHRPYTFTWISDIIH